MDLDIVDLRRRAACALCFHDRMNGQHIEKIVSGGQTGVDRAALDVALELGIPCGGWCPKGRAAEDGRIDERYPLRETETEDPAERTRRNVRDSDATLILARRPLTGGTALTEDDAHEHNRPVFVIDPLNSQAVENVRRWLQTTQPRVLNVAGPRASGLANADQTLAAVQALLRAVLRETTSR